MKNEDRNKKNLNIEVKQLINIKLNKE